MRYCSIADLHLGKRAQGRVVDGRNQREIDVEVAFDHAIQVVVNHRPDLLTIAGDCFDNVRPSMHAVRAYQLGIRRVIEETDAHVVIIPGNHCAPRTVETLTPNIVVDGMERVSLVTDARRVEFTARGTGERVSVSCYPFVAMQEAHTYRIEPDPTADRNVLLIHAPVRTSAVDGVLSPMYAGPEAIDVGAIAEEWDVIACGDYHEFVALHPTRAAFYSGSIERVSSDIWKERGAKGVVVGDTATGEFRLVDIPTRRMVTYDLDDFGLRPLVPSAEDVNGCLRQMVEANHPDLDRDALVRLRVDDLPRHERDLIDWAAVRELRERHVHFHLDLRWAETEAHQLGDRRERAHRSLADVAADWFADDDHAVRAAAFGYLGFDLPQEEVAVA